MEKQNKKNSAVPVYNLADKAEVAIKNNICIGQV